MSRRVPSWYEDRVAYHHRVELGLRYLVRPQRAARPGRDRAWGVQQERERVPLRGGKRGCCLGQFLDPDVQVAAGVVCGVPVVVVTLGWGGWGVGARPTYHSGSGFPLRR